MTYFTVEAYKLPQAQAQAKDKKTNYEYHNLLSFYDDSDSEHDNDEEEHFIEVEDNPENSGK